MMWEVEAQFMKSLFGSRNYGMFDFNGKKDKTKTFNILKARPDVENRNGWSLTVTRKQLKALKHSDIGVFMVNLTTGAMMGPHWNPMATEIAVVLQGRGMIRVVCSSTADEMECKNMKLRVEEGDVFVVPRFHPMTQISFNNESFVFMGFTTASRTNHPQFLAGKRSILQTLDKLVLAASFKVSNRTIEQLLAPQDESIILECTSCAENEEALMEEEIEREREEVRRREKEEARRREEEKRREEEEARKREEEEAKRREEEKKRREEEAEEEAAKRREEEEAARRREEEEEEEEEARRREEQRARKREDEVRRREEEEEAAGREAERRRQEAGQEEEEARRREEERERQQEGEEERERQQEEEKERREEGKEGRREREPEEQEGEEAAARREDEERERRAREEEAAARERESEGQEGAGGRGQKSSEENA